MDPGTSATYVTSLEEVLWGGTLVAVTMALHGFGMLTIVRVVDQFKERVARSPSFVGGLSVLVLASWLILIVHLIEVLAWAGFFYWKQAVNTQTSAPATTTLTRHPGPYPGTTARTASSRRR